MKNRFESQLIKDPVLYMLFGAFIAIAAARIYVAAGGSVDIWYDGILLHHFFFGMIVLALSGVLAFAFTAERLKNGNLNNALSALFGFGLGLVVDESNFFISAGQIYSVSQYYSVYNITVVIAVFVVLSALLIFTLSKRLRKSRQR